MRAAVCLLCAVGLGFCNAAMHIKHDRCGVCSPSLSVMNGHPALLNSRPVVNAHLYKEVARVSLSTYDQLANY